MSFGSVKLFWFSMDKFRGGKPENFGDILSKYIVANVSGKQVVWQNPCEINRIKRPFTTTYFAVGSILQFATNHCTIWGSGLIDADSEAPEKARYVAVRGPETASRLLSRGCLVPDVYGDPGLLTSKYFPLKNTGESPLGIVPHYAEVDDFKAFARDSGVSAEIKIIDLRQDVMSVIKEIVSCELILSSSLHGLIVPMSYGIPAYRWRYSDRISGDGIKYIDYFKSVNIEPYEPLMFDPEDFDVSAIIRKIKREDKVTSIRGDLHLIQDRLLSVQPF
jgi:pyruvyltransferase